MKSLLKLLYWNIVLLISFNFFGCKRNAVDIAGGWELVESSNCDVNFLNLTPIIYPFRSYGQKIYFENNRLINFNKRDSFQRFLPFDKSYNLAKNEINIGGLGQIEFQIVDSILLLSKNNCTLVFKRELNEEALSAIDIESVSMTTMNSDSVLVDSIVISKKEFSFCKGNQTSPNCRYMNYVFTLVGKLKAKHLNMEFDIGASDTNQYRIYLRNYAGNVFTVTSNGKNETPIEVLNLISYLRVYPQVD